MFLRTMMLVGFATLAACASMAGEETSAVLTQPSSQAHAEIVRIVSTALNVPTVTIAADALTRDSLLVIERTPARDAGGRRLQGRELGKPEQFQLLRSKNKCVLLHVGTGARYELTGNVCKPQGS
jgi:hypothetical protein